MPRIPTFAPTIEDCLSLSIGFLGKHGYLSESKKGKITWSTQDRTIGTISLGSAVQYGKPVAVAFSYSLTDKASGQKEQITQGIRLVGVSSNLGIGPRYYFTCPHTGKLASKLYKSPTGKRFSHRDGVGLLYLSQTRSKHWRDLEKSPLGLEFKREKLEEELLFPGKWRKRVYAGKNTYWYRKLERGLRKYKNPKTNESSE